ncbi:MAG: hypothetical protein R3F61_20990 [Myxococcota bacterium]
MKLDDWLQRQIERLGAALAVLLGVSDDAVVTEVDAALEDLVGLKLSVLERLAPEASTRLISMRYGEFSPERVYAALRLIDALVERVPARGPTLQPRRDALYAALLAEIGPDGIAALDRSLHLPPEPS